MAPSEPVWLFKHRQSALIYGPLPSGIDVGPVANSDIPQYKVTSKGKTFTFSNHPLSPGGRQEWGESLMNYTEPSGTQTIVPGAAHPPIVYKPGEWIWEPQESLIVALVRALQLTGVSVKPEDFTKNRKKFQDLSQRNGQLYHPHDRQQLTMFDDEHEASCWARIFGRGIVIVTPEISKDRKDCAKFFDSSAKNRNVTRVRWGTGKQETLPPVVLGCLPDLDPLVATTTSNFPTKWFTMVPTATKMKPFRDRFYGCNWAYAANAFGYASTDDFTWAVVAIQRSVVLNLPNIAGVPHANMGDAIQQYLDFLKDGYGRKAFKCTKPENSTAPRVHFHDMTFWILAAGKDTDAKAYANAWDSAMELFIASMKSPNKSDWDKFAQAAAAVQIKK